MENNTSLMKVTITLDRSGRRGKEVTLIKNIQHNPQHIEKIAKKTIEIQGNHVERVKPLLEKEGFTF